MTADEPEHPVRGLQRERTALAWDRTGLAFVVVGALLLRVGGPPYLHPRQVPAAVSILVGGLLVAGAAVLAGRRGDAGSIPSGGQLLILRAVWAATVAVSLASLAIVLLGA